MTREETGGCLQFLFIVIAMIVIVVVPCVIERRKVPVTPNNQLTSTLEHMEERGEANFWRVSMCKTCGYTYWRPKDNYTCVMCGYTPSKGYFFKDAIINLGDVTIIDADIDRPIDEEGGETHHNHKGITWREYKSLVRNNTLRATAE